MMNMPLGDRAALRVVGYYNEMPGYIDAHGPGWELDQNVNDGERQGGRVALRWELTDNIMVTPRVIYQDIDIDGYNRQDIWNILGNPFTTTEPPRQHPRAPAVSRSSTSNSTTTSSSAT